MDSKAITRRLNTLQRIADRGKPCEYTVRFKDGGATTADPISVWNICRTVGERVEGITAKRPEYTAAAGIMTVICRPAPDRRIEDFE